MKSRYPATERAIRQISALAALILSVILVGIIGFLATGRDLTGAFTMTFDALAGKASATSPHGLVIGLSLFGAIIMWFAIWTAFGLTIEGKFGAFLEEKRIMSEIKKISNHFIVCGAGKVGSHIGSRLKQQGHKVVFIEKDKDVIAKLKENFPIIDVGPIDSHVLKEAGIERAAGLAVALGDDGKNLLLILEARELNPHLKIAARVSNSKLIPKFKKAGADFIILPEALGGIKLADALAGNVDKNLVFTNDTKYLV